MPTLLLLFHLAAFTWVTTSARAEEGLVVGRTAPSFSLKDVDGNQTTLEAFRGRPVALCFLCGCEACRQFSMAWGQLQSRGAFAAPDVSKGAKRSPITLVVFQGNAANVQAFAQQTGLDRTTTVLLPDVDGRVTRSYQALPCPRICVLDSSGVVHYWSKFKDDAAQKASAELLVARVVQAVREIASPSPLAGQMAQAESHETNGLIVVLDRDLIPREDGVTCDLGAIDRWIKPRVERIFTLRNTGNQAVIVDRVQPSCACIDTSLLEGDQQTERCRLERGQEIRLRVAVDVTQQTPGALQKFVWVMANGGSTPALTIELDAITEAVARFSPSRLDFGRCTTGGARSLPLKILLDKRLVESGLQFEVACSNPGVRVVPVESRHGSVPKSAPVAATVKGGYIVRSYAATLSPEAAIGPIEGRIVVRMMGKEQGTADTAVEPGRKRIVDLLASVSIPVHGEVVGEISASPPSVTFDVVHPTQTPPLQVMLAAAHESALNGLQVSSSVPWITVRLLRPGKRAVSPTNPVRVLQVVVTPAAPAGPVQAQILVTTANRKRLILPVTAYVVPSPSR